MKLLPKIMIAPNGARKTKADHPALPMTIPEIINTAHECWDAGAEGIHVHVRDSEGKHTLDVGLYREAITELTAQIPGMLVQITTEAVGRYLPDQQRRVVQELRPEAVSVSIAEMLSDKDPSSAYDFYRWCDDAAIAVQHILYNDDDLRRLSDLYNNDTLAQPMQLLFVLGRYTKGQQSQPSDLYTFTHWLAREQLSADWAVCAFGVNETDCLLAAHQAGGKLRVGFENSLLNRDGALATSNAERVREIAKLIRIHSNTRCTSKG